MVLVDEWELNLPLWEDLGRRRRLCGLTYWSLRGGLPVMEGFSHFRRARRVRIHHRITVAEGMSALSRGLSIISAVTHLLLYGSRDRREVS